ncbi:hypothetical protein [Granulicella rosea]|uniref:hypothetical protein n=1 Tax=Granulicella rosea TaxID=474952 RepID=UPI00115CED99|nr:hypothetical protein [Granulicella rosea]
MTKKFVAFAMLSLLAALGLSRPAAAAPRDLTQYPLQVHILSDSWGGGVHRGYHGHGKGNVVEGSEIHGMEYQFHCVNRFFTSDADEDYPARWKKPGLKLEIVMGVIGSETKTRTCDLEVALKEKVYVKDHGKVESVSFEEYNRANGNRWNRATALNPRDADPKNYPLEMDVMAVRWKDGAGGLMTGSGQGNMKTERGLAAVDFTIGCPMKLDPLPDGRFYHARWRGEQGKQMTLLVEIPGNAPAVCELATTVHADVYVRQASGTLQAVPAAEYQRMLHNDATVGSR